MNPLVSSLKFIFIDIIADFIYWPIWWYTVGFYERLKVTGRQIKKTWEFLGLGIWLKNIFVPMYGDRSFLGRLISFFSRLIFLIWKLIWFVIWSALISIVLIIWIIGPVVIVWMIGKHFMF